MAITADVLLRNGITIKNAYIVIDCDISKIRWDGVMIKVHVFANAEARAARMLCAQAAIGYEAESPEYAACFAETTLEQEGVTALKNVYNSVKTKLRQNDADFATRFDFKIDATTLGDA